MKIYRIIFSSPFIEDFKEGIQLRELWLRLAWAETKRRYRRTTLGPLWVSLSLLIFSLVLSIVWANLWNINLVEFLPFLLSGLVAWTFISSCIGEATSMVMSAEAIIKNRKFPFSVLANTLISKQTIIFAHNLLVFYLIKILFQPETFNINSLMLLPGLFILILNLFWIVMLISFLCLRYRDFQQLVTIFLQIIMFITPIFWPRERLIGNAEILVDANLIYHLVDILRAPLLGNLPSINSYFVTILSAILGNIILLIFFNNKVKRFAYWF